MFAFSTVLFPLQLILTVYKTSLSTFNLAYLFFLSFLSTYLLVLFSLFYSPVGTLLLFCFPVCALVSFVLVDIIFLLFVCLLGQSIVIIFVGLFDFGYGCICTCVYSVTLFIVVISLCFYIGLLQFCGVFHFSSFFYNFNFSTYYIFSTFKPFVCFPTVIFSLQLIFNVYKSSPTSL